MPLLRNAVVLGGLMVALPLASSSASEMEWVRISEDGRGFALEDSGKAFVPWGFNYDHEGDGQLLEDYWNENWPAVASAFREMKMLGANVVRIHLQFGKFMECATEPRQESLDQLSRLLELAERVGLYIDLTGLGCYHKQDVPEWYDKLSERDRWAAQAIFWSVVAKTISEAVTLSWLELFRKKRVSILAESTSPDLPRTTRVPIREIDGPVDHNHCTTRQFQHMSFDRHGVWFVFYSDGQHFRYQTSDDGGNSWKRAEEPIAPAPNGSTSFDVLPVGDIVYICHVHYPMGRYDVNAPYAKDPARRGEYTHEGRIKKGQIDGRRIRWLQDVNPGFTPDYGNLVQDSHGNFWVFTREGQMGTAYRSRNPNDIRSWTPKETCIPVHGRHALDAAALDEGKLYAVSLLTTNGTLYGNLYDGQKWRDHPVLVADGLTSVAGDDRRLAVEFDPTQKRLHLVYVDAENRLRYRYLDSPYGPSGWRPALSEPGDEIAKNVFTAALSVDSSSSPYGLVMTYGIERYLGEDKRRRTGELYARRFDGRHWESDGILVSQPGTIHNWYPNVNQNAKNGLCVLYSRSIDKNNVGVPLAVMASLVTDFPSASGDASPSSAPHD